MPIFHRKLIHLILDTFFFFPLNDRAVAAAIKFNGNPACIINFILNSL